jgi:hypothetical protein
MAQSGLRDAGGSATSPDGATAIVGEEGIEALQENGQLVVKTGVGGEQRDYDIDSVSITDTTDTVANPTEVGATAELSGAIESDNSEPFTIKVEWQDDDANALYTETFGSDTDIVLAAVTIKSDNVAVKVQDDSAGGTANSVTGTLNFH